MSLMQYRKLPHGEEQISVLGLGMGSIHEGSEEEIEQTVRLAQESGTTVSSANLLLKMRMESAFTATTAGPAPWG